MFLRTEILGIARIQEFQEPDWERVCEVGVIQAKPDLAPLILEGAVVEAQHRWKKHEQKVLPTHLRQDTAESGANRVRTSCLHIMDSYTS
jgi:hypothetical protein